MKSRFPRRGKFRDNALTDLRSVNQRKIGLFFDAEEEMQEKYSLRKHVRGIVDKIVWDIEIIKQPGSQIFPNLSRR